MQVGKKYRGSMGTVYDCILLTVDGNAVLKAGRYEYFEYKQHFNLYTEVIEPVVRYVHWYKYLTDKVRVVATNDQKPPYCMRIGNKYNYIHLKTERIEYCG